MKRASGFFSPRTMRLLALGLAVVVVLYVLTRVYEGFQSAPTTEKVVAFTDIAKTQAVIIPGADLKDKLSAVELYAKKGCIAGKGIDATKLTADAAGYVNITSDAHYNTVNANFAKGAKKVFMGPVQTGIKVEGTNKAKKPIPMTPVTDATLAAGVPKDAYLDELKISNLNISNLPSINMQCKEPGPMKIVLKYKA